MSRKLFILILASLIVNVSSQALTEPESKDNSPNCDCYIVSGPDPSYFQYHRFWDFRNISDDPSGNDYTVAPPLITEDENAGLEPVTSDFLNNTAWGQDWQIQDWIANATADSPIMGVNSNQNIFISRNSSSPDRSTYLTMRASRLPDFMSISEFDSLQNNILYSSIRARIRVLPNYLSNQSAPSAGGADIGSDAGSTSDHPVDVGAVVGFFTYYSSTEESDIEILTQDPTNHIRYSNQPDYNYKTNNIVPGASTDFAIPDFDWTEWLEHRMDWHQGISRWYIDNQFMLSKTKNVPNHPSGLIINLWGDGGDWSGNMTIGGQVQVGFEWIEMVFNISGPLQNGSGSNANFGGKRSLFSSFLSKRDSNTCQVGCAIDGVSQVGFPEQIFNSTSAATSMVKWSLENSVYPATVFAMLSSLLFWVL